LKRDNYSHVKPSNQIISIILIIGLQAPTTTPRKEKKPTTGEQGGGEDDELGLAERASDPQEGAHYHVEVRHRRHVKVRRPPLPRWNMKRKMAPVFSV